MPLSTLFPYTMLFRSPLKTTFADKSETPTAFNLSAQGCEERATLGSLRRNAANPERVEAIDPQTPTDSTLSGLRPLCLSGPRDRKSTRLNSSHRCTSYASIYTLSLHDALPISPQDYLCRQVRNANGV